MPRTHGYSKKEDRCRHYDWGAKGRTNAIGALIGTTLLTVSLFESMINSEVFTAWVKQDLIPKLPQSSVIVMDNATFHKHSEMQDALATAGHTLLFFPPYSPDLIRLRRNGLKLNLSGVKLAAPSIRYLNRI